MNRPLYICLILCALSSSAIAMLQPVEETVCCAPSPDVKALKSQIGKKFHEGLSHLKKPFIDKLRPLATPQPTPAATQPLAEHVLSGEQEVSVTVTAISHPACRVASIGQGLNLSDSFESISLEDPKEEIYDTAPTLQKSVEEKQTRKAPQGFKGLFSKARTYFRNF